MGRRAKGAIRVAFRSSSARIDRLDIEIVAPLGLSVTRAALSALPNERANLSPEMALRTEKAFGASSDTLMRTQNSYDIAETAKRAGTIVVAPFAGRRIGAVSARSRDRFIPF